eukprot:4716001-Pleurochrysis_carterae.AAC.5
MIALHLANPRVLWAVLANVDGDTALMVCQAADTIQRPSKCSPLSASSEFADRHEPLNTEQKLRSS